MDLKQKIGDKVKIIREERHLTIEYLANISDVDRNYISDIEKGKRNVSVEILEKIVLALGTDLGTFFNDEKFKKV
ncbi:transcriptional regulator [Flavobacterium sp. LM5]|uniref:helix-turn-helix domain-containing protein n=1 Tax=Flavobacterium sp. LM5 TaxID=1938610 RepID=UPI0009919D53|nr:helix-turn-helix transcriptional regulator [Flavobacterium sp. LM5]OOV26553.1 transcriptional regulator [Flavobacterium sp. LM5]